MAAITNILRRAHYINVVVLAFGGMDEVKVTPRYDRSATRVGQQLGRVHDSIPYNLWYSHSQVAKPAAQHVWRCSRWEEWLPLHHTPNRHHRHGYNAVTVLYPCCLESKVLYSIQQHLNRKYGKLRLISSASQNVVLLHYHYSPSRNTGLYSTTTLYIIFHLPLYDIGPLFQSHYPPSSRHVPKHK